MSTVPEPSANAKMALAAALCIESLVEYAPVGLAPAARRIGKGLREFAEGEPNAPSIGEVLQHERACNERVANSARQMRLALKSGIIGAIQDLHTGDNTVQVMMKWSREFYDEIQGTES